MDSRLHVLHFFLSPLQNAFEKSKHFLTYWPEVFSSDTPQSIKRQNEGPKEHGEQDEKYIPSCGSKKANVPASFLTSNKLKCRWFLKAFDAGGLQPLDQLGQKLILHSLYLCMSNAFKSEAPSPLLYFYIKAEKNLFFFDLRPHFSAFKTKSSEKASEHGYF